MNVVMKQLILASQSPRRYQLLTDAGFKFHVHPVKVSEIIKENLNSSEVVLDLATIKAKALLRECPQYQNESVLILSADTLVVKDEVILGKPQDENEAKKFLRLLSGSAHEVKTGVCFYSFPEAKIIAKLDTTKVQFKSLSDQEIEAYIKTGEPMDKAGAYGIQGLGGKFVESTSGSWTNVVGLPMELVQETIKENSWNLK